LLKRTYDKIWRRLELPGGKENTGAPVPKRIQATSTLKQLARPKPQLERPK
jgi:hypothetical protein